MWHSSSHIPSLTIGWLPPAPMLQRMVTSPGEEEEEEEEEEEQRQQQGPGEQHQHYQQQGEQPEEQQHDAAPAHTWEDAVHYLRQHGVAPADVVGGGAALLRVMAAAGAVQLVASHGDAALMELERAVAPVIASAPCERPSEGPIIERLGPDDGGVGKRLFVRAAPSHDSHGSHRGSVSEADTA